MKSNVARDVTSLDMLQLLCLRKKPDAKFLTLAEPSTCRYNNRSAVTISLHSKRFCSSNNHERDCVDRSKSILKIILLQIKIILCVLVFSVNDS